MNRRSFFAALAGLTIVGKLDSCQPKRGIDIEGFARMLGVNPKDLRRIRPDITSRIGMWPL